jgi:prepilin-type N-terminal cleavage/methylation domain-containing protein
MIKILRHLRCLRYARNEKGLSLIEMLVAMAIFVLFVGLIITSYVGIVRSLRGAEEYRVMYSEARHSFEVITEVARNSRYYDHTDDGSLGRESGYNAAGMESFSFYSEDRMAKKTFRLDADEEGLGKIVVEEGFRDDILDKVYELELPYDLHSDQIYVKDMNFFVSPLVDPYLPDSFAKADYYHPKITVSVIFAKKNVRGDEFEMQLQTSISSRVYN